jgi:hypothetical protein
VLFDQMRILGMALPTGYEGSCKKSPSNLNN